MPKNKVTDLITDQEMAFARLVLTGSMTDRQAAEAVGLNPDSAAYIKSKPRVRAYMLEHRAAVQQLLVEQVSQEQHRLNLNREQVLARLWQIANLSPEMTRGSITGQVKALSMIVAMQNFIPDRRAASAEKKPSPAPIHHQIYQSAWLNKEEDSAAVPDAPTAEFAPSSAEDAPPNPAPSQSAFVNPSTSWQAPAMPPYVPAYAPDPDLRLGFSLKKNPFVRPR